MNVSQLSVRMDYILFLESHDSLSVISPIQSPCTLLSHFISLWILQDFDCPGVVGTLRAV